MRRFWKSVIQPIFEAENIAKIIEIGSDKGENTRQLLHYAIAKDGVLYAIDPFPSFPYEEWEKSSDGHFKMITDLSLNVLDKIELADVVLIDGDHNWYTVYHELMTIKKHYTKKFPIIFFHDICWPYDRRDLYYNPDNIPALYRNNYKKSAISPDNNELVECGLNRNLLNAVDYGTEHNGVKTAVEDFINNSSELGLKYYEFNCIHGLGMLVPENEYKRAVEIFTSVDTCRNVITDAEQDRLRVQMLLEKARSSINTLKDEIYTLKNGSYYMFKIYPDFGEGFSEATAIRKEYYSGNVCEEISFPKAPLRLRVDPVEKSYCVVSAVSVFSDKGVVTVSKTNGKCVDDVYCFDIFDSMLIFENIEKASTFNISMNITPFSSVDILEGFDRIDQSIKEIQLLDNQIIEIKNKLAQAVSDKNETEAKLAQVVSDKNETEIKLAQAVSDKNETEAKLAQAVSVSKKLSDEKTALKDSFAKKDIEKEKNFLCKINDANQKLIETQKKNSRYEAIINADRAVGTKLVAASKKIGWNYALKSIFKNGIRATVANIKGMKYIRKNGEFDLLLYCRRYPDVYPAMDPLVHFIWFGGYEGRNPSDKFRTSEYLNAYSDVKKSCINPYVHYMLYGKSEKRKSFVQSAVSVKPAVSAPAVKETLNVLIKSDAVHNFVDDNAFNEVVTSFEEIAAKYQEFYNYSALKPQIYPQKSSDEKMIEAYMQNAEKVLLDIYSMLNEDVLVSVIMPTYNRANVIGKAIESVIAQSYKRWELIIIDDGSNDNTEEIVKRYSDCDNRIKFINNNRKKGVSGARNTGLESAKGEYIAYLDTDNDWDSNYLLLMTNTLKINSHCTGIYCAQLIYRPENTEMKLQYIRFGAYNHSIIKNRNYIDMNCYMHRASMYKNYGGFSEELTRFVDWELIHRYSSYGYPYELPCCLSNYYFDRASNQITEKSSEAYRTKILAFDNEIKGEKLQLASAKNLDVNGYEFYSDKLNKYDCGKRNVSIIIPSYEALSCLITCIEAIKKFTADMNYEIIIVDNNSTDIVKQYLYELDKREEKVKVIINEHNMGFTYAVNQGIQNAMPDSDIILLNNDAIVTDGWIEELYRVKDTVNAGIIVPRQVLIPNTKTMNVHVPNCNQSRELDVSVSVHHHNAVDLRKYHKYSYYKLSFAPFFLVMITRECFEKLGYLDEKNGRHYKSDRLYCQKATENDIEIIYTPFSKAYHLLQQSTTALKESDVQMYKTIFVKNDWSDIGYKSSLEDKK